MSPLNSQLWHGKMMEKEHIQPTSFTNLKPNKRIIAKMARIIAKSLQPNMLWPFDPVNRSLGKNYGYAQFLGSLPLREASVSILNPGIQICSGHHLKKRRGNSDRSLKRTMVEKEKESSFSSGNDEKPKGETAIFFGKNDG